MLNSLKNMPDPRIVALLRQILTQQVVFEFKTVDEGILADHLITFTAP